MTYKTRTTFEYTVPKCSELEQFLYWKEIARTHPPHPRIGFCEDCTPEFQAEMKKQGRCENPEIVFYRDEGHVSGSFPRVEDREKFTV